MRTIIWLIVCFIILLLVPMAAAAVYYWKKKGMVLYIDQGRVKDPRFFGKSFAALVEKQLPALDGEWIALSKKEKYRNGDKKELPDEVKELVIGCTKDFKSPENVRVYQKEVYSGHNAAFDRQNIKLRAAYCRGRMRIGQGAEVVRWVDAEETLAVYDNCSLGISASAGNRMSIGCNCTFRRLFAAEILLGQYPEETAEQQQKKNGVILEDGACRRENISYVTSEDADEDGIFEATVISWDNVKVAAGITVRGGIRSHKSVRIFDGAVICGNIFAEQDVYLGENSIVLGNVFSQGSIYMEEYAQVGEKGSIRSVIARDNIEIQKNCFVYGYISCEKKGIIGPGEKGREFVGHFLEQTEMGAIGRNKDR